MPQQGASIARAACATPQPIPACTASTSASNARSTLFTTIRLILGLLPGNSELRRGLLGDHIRTKRSCAETTAIMVLLFGWASARRPSMRTRKPLALWVVFPLRALHSDCTTGQHEVGPCFGRSLLAGSSSHKRPPDFACESILKAETRAGRELLRRPLQFAAEKCENRIDRWRSRCDR